MQSKVEETQEVLQKLIQLVEVLSDEEVGYVFGRGAMDQFLRAFLDPKSVSASPSLAEFLLANKWRATLLTVLRHVITARYAFRGSAAPGFVTAHYVQWFEDGVMFTEGKKPFEGSIGLYRNGKLSFAVAAGDIRPGEELGPERLNFVDADEMNARRQAIALSTDIDLEQPGNALRALLDQRVNDEASYQRLLEQYPWMLGAQYRSMMRHAKLDDQNIPDFSAMRVHDAFRDIIEVKPPFMTLFKKDGSLSQQFNDAWNQAERYLEFARDNREYLARRGLAFSTPICLLVAGYGLTDDQIHVLRRKERLNPAIRLLTYEGVLALATNTARSYEGVLALATNTARLLRRLAKNDGARL